MWGTNRSRVVTLITKGDITKHCYRKHCKTKISKCSFHHIWGRNPTIATRNVRNHYTNTLLFPIQMAPPLHTHTHKWGLARFIVYSCMYPKKYCICFLHSLKSSQFRNNQRQIVATSCKEMREQPLLDFMGTLVNI